VFSSQFSRAVCLFLKKNLVELNATLIEFERETFDELIEPFLENQINNFENSAQDSLSFIKDQFQQLIDLNNKVKLGKMYIQFKRNFISYLSLSLKLDPKCPDDFDCFERIEERVEMYKIWSAVFALASFCIVIAFLTFFFFFEKKLTVSYQSF
jgi:hypothetical protein